MSTQYERKREREREREKERERERERVRKREREMQTWSKKSGHRIETQGLWVTLKDARDTCYKTLRI